MQMIKYSPKLAIEWVNAKHDASSSQGKYVETNNHIALGCQFGVTISLGTFRLWEEAGGPGENPRRHHENMLTPPSPNTSR